MKNDVQLFTNNELGVNVRVIRLKGGEPYFVASDVAKALGYSNTRQAIIDHCRSVMKHDIGVNTGAVGSGGNKVTQMMKVNIIPESDVYRLIMRSNLPSAEKFQDWVCEEVLPSIRKTHEKLKEIQFNGNIGGMVWSKNGAAITTSRVISKITEKRHDHVMRDIREEIDKLQQIHHPNLGSEDIKLIIESFKEVEYISENGQIYKEYELNELATMQLMLKYSTGFRAMFNIAFHKLKNAMISMFQAKVIEEVLPQDSKLRQYIYVIKNPLTNYVKIGVAQNPEQRLKQLMTGAGTELELCYKSMICSNAFEIEKKAHDMFKEQSVFGEWFNVDVQEATEFIERQTFVFKNNFDILSSKINYNIIED